jgi:hypothetical protein
MLTLIRETFPAVNVLFELGRPGASFAQGRVEAYRLSDILHHTRLQNVDQVVTCLELINEALRRVRGAADAAFYSLDSDGHCFIASQIQQNILRLWKDIIGGPVAGGPTCTAVLPRPAFKAEASQPLANSAFETPPA